MLHLLLPYLPASKKEARPDSKAILCATKNASFRAVPLALEQLPGPLLPGLLQLSGEVWLKER